MQIFIDYLFYYNYNTKFAINKLDAISYLAESKYIYNQVKFTKIFIVQYI